MKFASLFLLISSLVASLVFADQQVEFAAKELDSTLPQGEDLLESVDPEAIHSPDHGHRRLVSSFRIREQQDCPSTLSGHRSWGNQAQCASFCKSKGKSVFTLSGNQCLCNNKDCKNCFGNWDAWNKGGKAPACKRDEAQPKRNAYMYRIQTNNGPVSYRKVKDNARCNGLEGVEGENFYKGSQNSQQACASFCNNNYALKWFSFNRNKGGRDKCICWAARGDCKNKQNFPGYSLNMVVPRPPPATKPPTRPPTPHPTRPPTPRPTRPPTPHPTRPPTPRPTPATRPPTPKPTELVCSTDVKECPNGSTVGRDGPDCKFEICPDRCIPWTEDKCKEAAQELGLALGGSGYAFAGRYGGGSGCYFYRKGRYAGMAYFSTSPGDRYTTSLGGGKIRMDVCDTPKPTPVPTPTPTDKPTKLVCSTDVKECPDGSTVGRVGPDCEFKPCPRTFTPSPTKSPTPSPTNTVCATDTKQCPDGSFVKRVAPECEFVPCRKVATLAPTSGPTKGSSSGDPHFKTWTGDKFDYHGECDLVLVDNPGFHGGLGMKLHIRTTKVKYFSYIEKVALQIGDDVLEFDNDAVNFLINGEKVGPSRKHHTTMFAGFPVRRDKKAISVRLHDEGSKSRQTHTVAKIDFHTRKNGFPAVIVDGGNTDIFRGSLGLLGEWGTGLKMARDGNTELNDEDATAFALEWQVRDTEPMLFKEVRFPQFPTTCTPPKTGPALRISEAMRKEAEKACDHWEEDMDDCIFDVIATRDVLVAEEGHIVHFELSE